MEGIKSTAYGLLAGHKNVECVYLDSIVESRTCLYSPCIMCVQYRGGLQYRGGVQYRGDIMINVGGYLEYRGGVQYRGGYHEYRGGLS